MGLRRELILSTVMNLRPDIFLVDKKPGGVAGELEQSPKALKAQPEAALCYALPAGNDANERGTYLISLTQESDHTAWGFTDDQNARI